MREERELVHLRGKSYMASAAGDVHLPMTAAGLYCRRKALGDYNSDYKTPSRREPS
jgi:hypothetical protein